MTRTVDQHSFWENEDRLKKVMEKSMLCRLTQIIPWENFRPLLERGFKKEELEELRGSGSEERRHNINIDIDFVLIMFRILVVQNLLNFSDQEVAVGVSDNRSLEYFVGLGKLDFVPDAILVALFRKRLLCKTELTKELFHLLREYLEFERVKSLW